MAGRNSSIERLDIGATGPHSNTLVGWQLGTCVDGAKGAWLGGASSAVPGCEGDGVVGCSSRGEQKEAGEPGEGGVGMHI